MQEIKGTIESVRYKNEENGYMVASLKKENGKSITVVGIIPDVYEGKNYILKGEQIEHVKFGSQFSIENFKEIMPSTKEAIKKYLASGFVKGIGEITAKKIVDHFGEKTLEVMDSDIKRLLEVEGLGKKKVNHIAQSYEKQRDLRKIIMFFQKYGLTSKECSRIYDVFNEESINIVSENPYILVDKVKGIGFKTSDRIALNLGFDPKSPFRINSGITYIINMFCALGNTYMPMEKLIDEGETILCVSKEELNNSIYDLSSQLKIKVDIINEKECVFTMPFLYSELTVTEKIITLAQDINPLKIDAGKEINNFEKLNKIKFAPSQKEAIKGAIENKIEIITGGPGTGKTTIIKCITHIFEKENLKISMAAPTGRAAKRMSESTQREAKTIHRLLEMGVLDSEEEFFQGIIDGDSPLNCDVLLLDEASMIDINLMSSLLKALRTSTRVIIVGDVDQLPSVGPGKVLKDLIDSHAVKVVRLKEVFRQEKESLIVENAHRINNGQMPLLNSKDKDFFFINKRMQEEIISEIIGLIKVRLPKFNKRWKNMIDIQVLTPTRKGDLGCNNLNNHLQEVLNPHNNIKKDLEYKTISFRIGDKVMQTKNNYNLAWKRKGNVVEKEGKGIFNGDIGFIDDIDEENNQLTIIFDDDKIVKYDEIYFDELELAYAMTIHKSQGSEFPVVVMPVFMGASMLMNRNLLYTAVTRAKEMVVIVGDKKALHFMVNNTEIMERYSALSYRIQSISSNFFQEK